MWTVAAGRVYVVGVGVNSLHVGYVEALGRWARARDVIAGEDAVKAGGVKYLPRLDAQTDGDYAAYLGRACFFNATSRAVEGYVGMLFRRQPAVKFSTGGENTRDREIFLPARKRVFCAALSVICGEIGDLLASFVPKIRVSNFPGRVGVEGSGRWRVAGDWPIAGTRS